MIFMIKSREKLCDFCLQQPATTGGLWLGPGLGTRLCRDCLTTALTYDYLIDSLRRRQALPEAVAQKAKALLKDMSERMGLNTETLKQELAALGVPLEDTAQ